MKPIARSSGRSAVAAAAYRAGECLTNERDGLTHDYTRKAGIEHAEIVLPKGSTAEWARDRSALWNAAEAVEKRSDARVAREFEIALPHELTPEERLEATRGFAQVLADRYGTAVDFAIHSPNGETDIRNHHAHLMMTVRGLTETGLGEKTSLERENAWLLSRDMPTSMMQLKDIRRDWEGIANEALAQAGHDLRVDHRSHQDRGLEIEPTEHMGVYATQMERRGLEVVRQRLDAKSSETNAQVIREKPEQVLAVIASEKSVFDRYDVARALHRYIDQPEAFQSAFSKVMASPALIELRGEIRHEDGSTSLARYSTREMVETERGMALKAEEMVEGRAHSVSARHVDEAIGSFDRAIRQGAEAGIERAIRAGEVDPSTREALLSSARLGDEQRAAVRHVTGPEGISVVVGLAGAGKSTMLGAARAAWEAEGYQVQGAALAGKAAEGLEESSGIKSRTLASLEHSWQNGHGKLGPRDVLVIDEAGMVGSRQLARFVAEAQATGAKLVMVGDHEQLQAIGAGAPFRAIAERIGFAELTEIRRQREDWQREASHDLARHRTAEALSTYREKGAIQFHEKSEDARAGVVRSYMEKTARNPEASCLVLAHRRQDVRALNESIRSARHMRGEFAPGGQPSGERIIATNDGERAFAQGDRVIFLENSRELNVKNGMLGTVTDITETHLSAVLDAKNRDGSERAVTVPLRDYAAIDHGYATTIHKTQGATVDKTIVLGSASMDRHLTYVAMTRHRDGVELHASREEFKGGMEALTARLSRDGTKETTLDYATAFAERRGIGDASRLLGQIEVPHALQAARDERGEHAEAEELRQGARAGEGDTLRWVGEMPVWERSQRGEDRGAAEQEHRQKAGQGQVEPGPRAQEAQEPGSKGPALHARSDAPASDEIWSKEANRRGSSEADLASKTADRRGLCEIDHVPKETGRLHHDSQQADREAAGGAHDRLLAGNAPDRAGESKGAAHSSAEPDGQVQNASAAEERPVPDAKKVERDTVEQTPAITKSAAADKPRGIFSGLKLESRRGQERSEAVANPASPFSGLKLPAQSASERAGADKDTEKPAVDSKQAKVLSATEAYARAYTDAARMATMGLPVVEHQKVALEKASAALDAVNTGIKPLLDSALKHDPEARRVLSELKGPERAAALSTCIAREYQAQQDPKIRAERFVAHWSCLEAEQAKLRSGEHGLTGAAVEEAKARVTTAMREAAETFGKDQEASAVLRADPKARGVEQGSSLGRALQAEDTGKALTKAVERESAERERGQGYSM